MKGTRTQESTMSGQSQQILKSKKDPPSFPPNLPHFARATNSLSSAARASHLPWHPRRNGTTHPTPHPFLLGWDLPILLIATIFRRSGATYVTLLHNVTVSFIISYFYSSCLDHHLATWKLIKILICTRWVGHAVWVFMSLVTLPHFFTKIRKTGAS